MKQTHHHFLITLAVAVTLLVTSLYIYMRYTISNLTDDAVNARSKVLELQSDREMDIKLKMLNNGSEGNWNKLYGAFVNDDAVSFIENLESIGTSTGSVVTITSIDNVAAENGSLAKNGYVNAKVSIQGSWTVAMKSLMLMENMPYVVKIGDVSFDASGSLSDKSVTGWVVKFDITAVKSI